jgi:hypothetical protein
LNYICVIGKKVVAKPVDFHSEHACTRAVRYNPPLLYSSTNLRCKGVSLGSQRTVLRGAA